MEQAKVGSAVPSRGNWLTRSLGRTILRLMGWKLSGSMPDLPRFVIIAAPHTSNWDFIVGVAARLVLNIDAHWLGKHTLFQGPLAPLLRWLHGVPVNRSSPRGLIDDISGRFKDDRPFVLALAPEGTRSKVKQWKSGFYSIAIQAGVPVVPVALDYGSRTVEIFDAFWPTGQLEQDLAQLQGLYKNVTPRHPELF